jgi:UDP-2,3-diacylglucosamine pyrophosphatase LpxH
MSGAPRSSLLIVSDLHLGASLRPPMTDTSYEMIDRLDSELEQFLAYHIAHPAMTEEGIKLPWTLVFNGDTIDFMHMGLTVAGHIQLEAEEAMYGLSFVRRRSRWKLQEIAKYHHVAFKALAHFLEHGNQCVFVVGNHDADLWFEKVRRDLRSLIARHTRKPKATKRAIHFAPWFYYEEGRVYIEHGHRFDAYSTFPDPLNPVDLESGELKPTFGHWGLRYFCNPVPTLPIHDLEHWGAVDFLRWAWTKAGVDLVSLVAFYLNFLWRYLKDTAEARINHPNSDATQSDARTVRMKRRGRRLARFAKKAKLNIRRVRQLDQLREAHIGESLGRFALAAHMHKFILMIISAVGLLLLLLYTKGWMFYLCLSLGLVFISLSWIGLSRLRPIQDPHPYMSEVAQKIGEITDVPLVVLGHTHRPVLENDGDVKWLNPGSWEHLPRSPGHAPDAPCTCAAKFGVIKGEGDDMEVGLYQWCSEKKSADLIINFQGDEQDVLGKLSDNSSGG